MAALSRANEVRTLRAQLTRDLKARKVSIGALLLDPPPYLETAKVFDMVLAIPKVGRVKVHQDPAELPGFAQQDVRRPERAPASRARRAPAPALTYMRSDF
jgi:hypothetical protein